MTTQELRKYSHFGDEIEGKKEDQLVVLLLIFAVACTFFFMAGMFVEATILSQITK